MEELNKSKEEIMKKVQDYKEIIESFSALLKEENQALSDFSLDIISSLYEKKSQTVMAYRTMVAYFIKNRESLRELSDDERMALKNSSQALDELLQENDRLLRTRMETSKTVMDSIVNIAKVTNNANATSYGNHGHYTPLDNSKNALAINRTL